MKLVKIEWEDSKQPIPAWNYIDDIEDMKPCQCVSVGYLIKDNKRVKILAPNIADIKHDTHKQVCGVITIPTSCVKRITTLEKS